MKRLIWAIAMAALITPALAQTPQVTAFVDVHVVPMDRERVLDHQTVLVSGTQVTTVGPVRSVKLPAGHDATKRSTACAWAPWDVVSASSQVRVRSRPWRGSVPRVENCGKITGTPPRTAWPSPYSLVGDRYSCSWPPAGIRRPSLCWSSGLRWPRPRLAALTRTGPGTWPARCC